MSRKSNLKKENNPFLMVLYIIGVLALIGGLVFLYLQSGKRKEEYKELVQQVKENEDLELKETSWITEEDTEEDSEEEPEDEAAKDTEDADKKEKAPEEDSRDASKEQKKDNEQQEDTDTSGQKEETEAEPTQAAEAPETAPTAADSNLSVVVLNGTGRDGVAAQWTETLKNGGYANTIPATYTGASEEQTVIYAASEEQGAPFLELFPNGTVRVGSLGPQGILTGAGVNLPAQVDVYIVIGKTDAAVQQN